MKKEKFFFCIALILGGFAICSCSVDDLQEQITGGTQEDVVIAEKCKGTLEVKESHQLEAALFNIESNPYGVESIEFAANGAYHITFGLNNTDEELPARIISVDVDGQQVNVPMRALTRSNRGLRSTGTYTYENGRYVLMDYGWQMDGDRLIIVEDGITRSYQATRVTRSETAQDALSKRLCHTWTLNRVLMKLYNAETNGLVMTYHLTDEEVKEYCIDTFVFSEFSINPHDATKGRRFYRYKDGMNNGNGRWNWKSQSEQTLSYAFEYLSFESPEPVKGSNDLTVYFADNRLYITEAPLVAVNEDVEGIDGKTINLRAVLLYQLDVKGDY